MKKINLQIFSLAILITLSAFNATAQIDNIDIHGKIVPFEDMDFASQKPTNSKFETTTKGYYSPPILFFYGKASPARTTEGKIGDANIRIAYSSPAVKDRQIWGGLVPYNKIWRAGANEATTFEVDRDIKVEGKDLKAGKYSIYAIPSQEEWTIIFNKEADNWGTQYDEAKDELRVMVAPRDSDKMNEHLSYEIKDDKVMMYWERIEIPISISKQIYSKSAKRSHLYQYGRL